MTLQPPKTYSVSGTPSIPNNNQNRRISSPCNFSRLEEAHEREESVELVLEEGEEERKEEKSMLLLHDIKWLTKQYLGF